MRNFKRFLTLVLAALMVASTFVVSTSAAFTDVSADDKALTKAINLLSYLEVTKGTTETTFSPDTLVTREQMAAFIYRLMKAGKSVEGGANTSVFTDLEDPTFFYMCSWANNQGVIKGITPTEFNPKGNITLQDAYTMIIRALGYENKETLPYPFGYIDLAEEKELDENLPSTITYTDALSRGNVAILLYNTFFTEMYNKDVSYKIEYVYDDDGKMIGEIQVPVTANETVAVKVFGVEETEQTVVATPNYYLNDYKIDTTFDVDVLMFVDGKGNSAGYRAFEDLDLEGKADDYFLSDFTLYLKEQTVDGKKEKVILYAEPLLVKKEGVRADVALVGSKKANNIYGYEENGESYYKPSGLLTIDGVKTYMFDAPYSYSKPSITTSLSDSEYYAQLNKNNIEFIGLAEQEEEGKYHFVTGDFDDQNEIRTLMKKAPYTDKSGNQDESVLTYSAETFGLSMGDMYWNGYYEMDTYDCDGDGLIDYAWYKPFTFGKLVSKEDRSTVTEHADWTEKVGSTTVLHPIGDRAINEDGVPTIFTYDAMISGAKFKDKDFALAYVNGPANYIKVSAVVEGSKASIINKTSSWDVNLSNGSGVHLADVTRYVYGFYSGDISDGTTADDKISGRIHPFSGLANASNWEINKMFYTLDGRLLYTDSNTTTLWNTENSILVTLGNETQAVGATVNNALKQMPYLDVYSYGDKEVTLVPVETEGNDPKTPSIKDANGKVIRGVYDFSNYAGKLCTFTEDTDGIHTIELATNKGNGDVQVLQSKDDAGASYANVAAINNVYFKQISGNSYSFLGDYDDTSTVNNLGSQDLKYVQFRDYTKVIIKTVNELDEEIFVEYSSAKLPKFSNELTNVQLVLVNNPNSTRTEYVAAMYAESVSAIDAGSDIGEIADYRIVKTNSSVSKTNENYHYNYTVYNPVTGKIENAISLVSSATATGLGGKTPAKIGGLYAVIDGVLQDKKVSEDDVVISSNANRGQGQLEVLLGHEGNELDIQGHTGKMLKTDKNTIVSFLELTGTSPDSGSISVATLEDLSSTSNKFKNYAEKRKTDDPNSKLVTVYEENMEVFFKLDDTAKREDYELVEFVMIVRRKFSADQFEARNPAN